MESKKNAFKSKITLLLIIMLFLKKKPEIKVIRIIKKKLTLIPILNLNKIYFIYLNIKNITNEYTKENVNIVYHIEMCRKIKKKVVLLITL